MGRKIDGTWLYPQNQAFVNGESKTPFHHQEVMHNMGKVEFSLLTPPFIITFTIIGVVLILGAIFVTFGTVYNYINPICNYGYCVRPKLIAVLGVPLTSIMMAMAGVVNLRWGVNAYHMLKYPTLAERYYYLVMHRGRLAKGVVTHVDVINEHKVLVHYYYKTKTYEGKYETISPVARTLKHNDDVIVYYHGDYSILL
jgi:hypothetical protein